MRTAVDASIASVANAAQRFYNSCSEENATTLDMELAVSYPQLLNY